MKDKEIQLSKEQLDCINCVVNRFIHNEMVTVISAPAGSGKTTLIPYIVEELGLFPEEVRYVTLTGKAVRMMRDRGIEAETIHHLIYDCEYDEITQDFTYHLVSKNKLKDVRLIIIDELSMLETNIFRDLLSFDIPILCLGDEFQLPPIGNDNRFLERPNFRLTHVFRQNQDSGILDIATQIRTTGEIDFSREYSDVTFVRENDLLKLLPYFKEADVVLCGSNAGRRTINRYIRQSKGIDTVHFKEPLLRERLIFTRNYWNVLSDKGEPLTNGTTGEIIEYQKQSGARFDSFADIVLVPDFDKTDRYRIRISLNQFHNVAPQSQRNTHIYPQRLIKCECDFAYALTAHKAQGSQWENVLVYTQDMWYGDFKKVLYTAVTRAQKKLVLTLDSK